MLPQNCNKITLQFTLCLWLIFSLNLNHINIFAEYLFLPLTIRLKGILLFSKNDDLRFLFFFLFSIFDSRFSLVVYCHPANLTYMQST